MSHCRARLATAGGEKCGREQKAAVVYPEGTCLTKARNGGIRRFLKGLVCCYSFFTCGWAMDPG